MRTTLNNIGTKKPTDPGMYGVQTWSAGPIYPAVIAVIETYSTPESPRNCIGTMFDVPPAEFYDQPLGYRFVCRAYRLSMPGHLDRDFQTREYAEEFALTRLPLEPN